MQKKNASAEKFLKVLVIAAFFGGRRVGIWSRAPARRQKNNARDHLAGVLQTKFVFENCIMINAINDLSKQRGRGSESPSSSLSPHNCIVFFTPPNSEIIDGNFVIRSRSILFAGPFFGPSSVLKSGPSLPYKRCKQVLRARHRRGAP